MVNPKDRVERRGGHDPHRADGVVDLAAFCETDQIVDPALSNRTGWSARRAAPLPQSPRAGRANLSRRAQTPLMA